MNKNALMKEKTQGYIIGLLMVAPTIIGLIVLNIYPFFRTIWMSFHKSASFGSWNFIGLKNYTDMFTSDSFWKITFNTILFVIYTVPLTLVLALIIAVFLNQKIRGKTFFRMIYFLPMVVAAAAVAMVWRWMFNSEYGIINQFLGFIGLPSNISWITDPRTALLSCAIVTIWSSIGYDAILLLSGLQGISNVYYEAAKVEGASALAQFKYITVPLLSPTLFFVIVMRIMSSLKVFDIIYMMIDTGNPAIRDVETILYVFYRESFVKNNKGYGSTLMLWAVVIIMAITFFQFKFQKKWVNYDA